MQCISIVTTPEFCSSKCLGTPLPIPNKSKAILGSMWGNWVSVTDLRSLRFIPPTYSFAELSRSVCHGALVEIDLQGVGFLFLPCELRSWS